MGACWTKKERQYITKDTKITPYPSSIFDVQYKMLKRECRFPIERTTSSHAPLGIRNTKGEHEAYQAPRSGFLCSPRKGRDFLIEAIRGERKRRHVIKRLR